MQRRAVGRGGVECRTVVKNDASLADWRHDLARKLKGSHSVDVIGLGYVSHLVPYKTLVVAAIYVTQRTIFRIGVIEADPCSEHIITAGHAKVPTEYRGTFVVSMLHHYLS
jgi:hypothetical protein